MAHGSNGFYIYPDGSYYYGAISNNKAEGKGCFVYNQGELKYEGEWLNDKPHGKGVETLEDQSQYTGYFECGLKAGKEGVFVWPNGDRYQGEFRDGVMKGQGTFETISGYRYKGEWENNQRHGHGVETFPSGRVVSG